MLQRLMYSYVVAIACRHCFDLAVVDNFMQIAVGISIMSCVIPEILAYRVLAFILRFSVVYQYRIRFWTLPLSLLWSEALALPAELSPVHTPYVDVRRRLML